MFEEIKQTISDTLEGDDYLEKNRIMDQYKLDDIQKANILYNNEDLHSQISLIGNMKQKLNDEHIDIIMYNPDQTAMSYLLDTPERSLSKEQLDGFASRGDNEAHLVRRYKRFRQEYLDHIATVPSSSGLGAGNSAGGATAQSVVAPSPSSISVSLKTAKLAHIATVPSSSGLGAGNSAGGAAAQSVIAPSPSSISVAPKTPKMEILDIADGEDKPLIQPGPSFAASALADHSLQNFLELPTSSMTSNGRNKSTGKDKEIVQLSPDDAGTSSGLGADNTSESNNSR
jgi:hypothetical protein